MRPDLRDPALAFLVGALAEFLDHPAIECGNIIGMGIAWSGASFSSRS